MWYIILSLIGVIYILLNLVLPGTFGGFIEAYVIRPALWILLAISVYMIARREGLNIWNFKKFHKWEIGRNPFDAALLIGGFQISLLVIIGLFLGFGPSPYSHTPAFIIINIIFVGSALFGIELSRAYLIKKGSSKRRNLTLTLALVTLLFMFISISLSEFTSLDVSQPAEMTKFFGETLIPGLAMGLFASYLAYLGGALSAIGYMGMIQGFQWFSPYLPAVDWALAALIGTIGPAIGFIIIQNSIQVRFSGKKAKRKKMKDPALPWMVVALISVLLIFFSFGYLSVQPTVIYSGSMRTTLDIGDVVLISETPVEEIREGDIIQYRVENMTMPIVHRVYEINKGEDYLSFVTKGDDNSEPDKDPILPEQIMGKVVFNLPKIGWISIVVKEALYNIGIRI